MTADENPHAPEQLAPGWYVEITERATGKVIKRRGPMDERKAEKVCGGASINLDHDRFSVDTREVSP